MKIRDLAQILLSMQDLDQDVKISYRGSFGADITSIKYKEDTLILGVSGYNEDALKVRTEEMSDKIKLEDMTLKQIRELKEDLKKRIGIAISNVLLDFYENFEVGEVGINVKTIVNPPMESENGYIIVPQKYTYSMGIHFSNEDDYETPQD